MSTAFWFALSNIEGMGVKTLKRLYSTLPNISRENIYENIEALKKIIKNSSILQKVLDEKHLDWKILNAEKQINLHAKDGIQVIDIASEYYPKLLRFIDDPPAVLFCKGNIELLKGHKKIAIVGTRNATEKGLRAAMKISSQFCRREYVIVSGLAMGIDTAGHMGALRTNGKTIAVLAGSLDKIYPKENTNLANEIINKQGLLISETPLGGKTFRNSFVKRDRIQSGLSLGVCPVQTPLKSGTQHTIKFAQDQERLLFCPEPLEDYEVEATQGIYYLLNNNLASKISNENDYERIIDLLTTSLENLLEKNEVNNSRENTVGKRETPVEQNDVEQLSFSDYTSKNEEISRMLGQLDDYLLKIIDLGVKLEMNQEMLIKRFQDKFNRH
jgi:DNA processing protein